MAEICLIGLLACIGAMHWAVMKSFRDEMREMDRDERELKRELRELRKSNG